MAAKPGVPLTLLARFSRYSRPPPAPWFTRPLRSLPTLSWPSSSRRQNSGLLDLFRRHGNDTGQGIALDAAGDIWITGSTSSYDLPATPGSFQNTLEGETNAFTAKFSNDGKLLAATYLGGSNNDAGLGIAVDPQGNPWLIGSWTSTDFPFTTAPPASLPFPAAGFLTEFDPSAARLLYSTNVNGRSTQTAKASPSILREYYAGGVELWQLPDYFRRVPRRRCQPPLTQGLGSQTHSDRPGDLLDLLRRNASRTDDGFFRGRAR